ncbi:MULTISPECIES: hypothetical protein [Streptomyces]|uniref:RNA polymerase sigma factor 70 region 4 type 2 domain-containing protein n=1 Tax=Streptomyces rochei TaxID=1928 RepID=A0ABW7E8U3_STRRO
MPFSEIGTVLGESADATKMLASRARRKVQAAQQPAGAGRRQREAAKTSWPRPATAGSSNCCGFSTPK